MYEAGDVVTLKKSELNSEDMIGEKFEFVSYLKTPFRSSEKSNVILDCVVCYEKWHILMPAKSQNLMLINSVERRFNNSQLSIEARYSVRIGAPTDATITVSSDDFVMMAEMMLMGCGACPQGKYVKDCPYRAMFHRVGIPIGREDVKEGQCEFMVRDVPKVIMPNGHADPEERKMFSDTDRELLL